MKVFKSENDFSCKEEGHIVSKPAFSPDGSMIAYERRSGGYLTSPNYSENTGIYVIPAGGGETVWMKTPGDPRETYVPRMEWHPAGEELMVQWLPRQQNHLVVFGCDVETGALRKVHEERDQAYVDVREDFRWTKGGEAFFWTSDVAFRGEGDEAWRQAGTVAWRNGWQWGSVDGPVEVCGPDNALAGVDAAAVPELLRQVFRDAGGTHDDWDEYDRVMADERRTAVFVQPTRILGRT